VDILIAPARVQGTEAVGEIISALRNLHSFGGVDVIIVARGGGSLEDLAPFNDEALAREIFRSSIPVISAVGHETDFTICDFVADLRAPTPSVAAELVVPRKTELLENLCDLKRRLAAAQRHYLDDRKDRMVSLKTRFRDPRRFIADYSIHLDDLRERIQRAVTQHTQTLRSRLAHLNLGLQNQNPQKHVRECRIFLGSLEKDIVNSWTRYFREREARLNKSTVLLSSLNPLAVLQRGYSITRRLPDGKIIRQVGELMLDEKVGIQLAEGTFQARVEKIQGE
jgi:exodeoxyribonuclease VII large subunit